jgi:hypothetical protein
VGVRPVRLRTAFDVQRALGKVFNEVRRGELAVDRARTLIYCLSVMKGVVETAVLESRLDEIEARMRKSGSGA